MLLHHSMRMSSLMRDLHSETEASSTAENKESVQLHYRKMIYSLMIYKQLSRIQNKIQVIITKYQSDYQSIIQLR